jgi:glycosyltransferase involved in cell wall biosynthesis
VTLLDVKKTLIRFWPVRVFVGLFFLARGLVVMPFAPYRGIADLCWVHRVSGVGLLRRVAHQVIVRYVFDRRAGDGRLLKAFLDSSAAVRAANRILKREAEFDSMFRDIMVLKAPARGEKGVIVLEYTARFDLFVALFDFDRIIQDYYIVLEPCWAGYCDPSILMFISSTTDIIVQAPEQRDFEFISGLNCNLKPINLGSSDWIDADLFAPPPEGSPRPYDLIMVANWAKHKNHRKLFAALEHVRHKPISVLLVGVDWGGRTGQDILAEMRQFDLPHVTVELKTNIPAREVAMHLGRSKTFLLLSEKEGSNRAIVEALFANTPAILYENFVGGAKGKVNAQTGTLSSFESLAIAIDDMLDRHAQFTPRAWALQHTGSRNATAKLNALLKSIAESRGETWTIGIVEKVNNPNFNYKHPDALPAQQQAPAIARAYLRDEARSLVESGKMKSVRVRERGSRG